VPSLVDSGVGGMSSDEGSSSDGSDEDVDDVSSSDET